MKKGYLNKVELRQLGRAYTDLGNLAKLTVPSVTAPNDTEEATYEKLKTAQNAIADILRWQSFGTVWQEVNS